MLRLTDGCISAAMGQQPPALQAASDQNPRAAVLGRSLTRGPKPRASSRGRRAVKGAEMYTVDIGVRSLTFRWSLKQKAERLFMAFVWKLPHHLVYWCAIRVWANATSGRFGSEEATATLFDDALRRWERRERGDPSFR